MPPFGTYSSIQLGFTPVLCDPSSLCYPPESIAGNIFNDANGNGQLDIGEQPFLNGVAEAQPGNYLSGVDVNGNYVLPVDTGTYIVQGQPVPYYNITTPMYNVSILSGQIDTLSHIGYQLIPTNIAELEIDGLKMWPNPVNGDLWLLLTDPEPTTIEVLDLTGKMLSSQKTNGTREQLIDVNQLVSGVYFVRVINVDGIRSGRFVKL